VRFSSSSLAMAMALMSTTTAMMRQRTAATIASRQPRHPWAAVFALAATNEGGSGSGPGDRGG
jgi:hypothetical protein